MTILNEIALKAQSVTPFDLRQYLLSVDKETQYQMNHPGFCVFAQYFNQFLDISKYRVLVQDTYITVVNFPNATPRYPDGTSKYPTNNLPYWATQFQQQVRGKYTAEYLVKVLDSFVKGILSKEFPNYP